MIDGYTRGMADPTCPECQKLILELCRANYELGKAQGQLSALSWPFAISPHEAWEAGRAAGRHDRNPFPRPPEGEGSSTPQSNTPPE